MQELDIRIHEEERNRRRVPSMDVVEATTFDDVLAVLRRQFVPLAACAVLGVVLGLVHHVTSPKQYYTAATVLVDERPTQLPEEMNASSPFVRNDTSLLNEIQVLRSLELATAVVEQTELHNNDLFWSPPSSLARTIISAGTDTLKSLAGLGEDAAPSATTDTDDQESARILAAASKLQRDIGIERIGLSFSIEISYVGHDPALAALLVNTYADAYLADHLSANLEKTQRTAEWMRNRLADLQQRSEAVSREAANLRESDPTQVQTLRELAQQATNLDALSQTLSNQYEQIGIQGSFPVTNGRVLTRSLVPEDAALPKPLQTVALTTILGLMLGFGIAALREMRERAFRTGKDVSRHTGRQFLGYLPRMKPGALSGVPAGLPPHLFWSALAPQSLFHDTLHGIHASVDPGAARLGCKVVGITSMLRGDGKTTLAANYANMLATSGARTLLIDMDPQGDGLGSLSREENATDADPKDADAIRVLDETGLHLLPCLAPLNNSFADELKYHNMIAALIVELRAHYEYIVVDMPALCEGSGAKVASAQIDKIVMVCKWGKTPRNLVTAYLSQEPDVSQKVVGITLSQVNMRSLPKYAHPGSPENYFRTHRRAI